ncbi:MAG: GxxExxY protein [Anaerolineales bacterium]|nr:GxxExxY protein [Anaerolineales bacterium]MCW5887012.1 GxxExxY protein [Anaerolineales bacterium]
MNQKERANELSKQIIGAAIEVHSALGPGLLESAYLASLCHELSLRGIAFAREVALPVKYKDVKLEAGYRMDLLVEGLVIVETKTVERIQAIHEAQLLTYLKLTDLWLGLLLNFNVLFLKHGIRRVVNG